MARKLESSPNLAFYPSRAALKETILGHKKVLNEITDEFFEEFIRVARCLSHKDDGNRQKGCIVDKLLKFMGICYLNQFTFHGFINIQVRASEISIRVTE